MGSELHTPPGAKARLNFEDALALPYDRIRTPRNISRRAYIATSEGGL